MGSCSHWNARSALHTLAMRSEKNHRGLPTQKGCSTSSIHLACSENCSGNTVSGSHLQPALLPKCPVHSSCQEQDASQQYGLHGTGQILATWPSTQEQWNQWGCTQGVILLCRRATRVYIAPSHSASVVSTVSQGTGMHTSHTQPLVIAFQIYLHSL